MATFYKLTLPEPCTQKWESMMPMGKNRYCTACEKTIMDFSTKSDAEIIDFFKHYKGNVCGRFTRQQLDREIIEPRRSVPFVNQLFKWLVPGFLFSAKAVAQAPTSTNHEQHIAPEQKKEIMKGDTITISGRVVEDSGEPIPFASVIIKGTTRGVATNEQGAFTLKNILQGSVLQVSSVGFVLKEVKIDKQLDTPLIVLQKMQLEHESLITIGAVVITSHKKPKKTPPIIKEPSMLLYPNPHKKGEPLHIKFDLVPTGKYALVIYATNGRRMYEETFMLKEKNAAKTIEPNLIPGNYVVKVVSENGKIHVSQQLQVLP